jgi:hypothetical protein
VDHHDDYAAALTEEVMKGHRDKLTLLRGHSGIATRIEGIGLSEANVESLFQNYDSVSNTFSPRQSASYAAAAVKSPDMGSIPAPQVMDGKVSPDGLSQTRLMGRPISKPV